MNLPYCQLSVTGIRPSQSQRYLIPSQRHQWKHHLSQNNLCITHIVIIFHVLFGQYPGLSSTLPEIDPDTAYLVCISVSFGFRQQPSDTALFSVIALTTFNCIVSASITKGALFCFVVTVHWWRHRTHYDFTEAYHALHNILTVHLNNGATRSDLRGIPKHY